MTRTLPGSALAVSALIIAAYAIGWHDAAQTLRTAAPSHPIARAAK